MARFFIDRPIFAWVISLGILLSGFIALRALPIEQYPDVAPPQVNIRATYPGASAETVAQSVAAPIEQQSPSPVLTKKSPALPPVTLTPVMSRVQTNTCTNASSTSTGQTATKPVSKCTAHSRLKVTISLSAAIWLTML